MLLPASTNSAYRGAAVSAWFLALVAVLTIVFGLIHYFLSDGGVGVIAGIDLGAAVRAPFAVFTCATTSGLPATRMTANVPSPPDGTKESLRIGSYNAPSGRVPIARRAI